MFILLLLGKSVSTKKNEREHFIVFWGIQSRFLKGSLFREAPVRQMCRQGSILYLKASMQYNSCMDFLLNL